MVHKELVKTLRMMHNMHHMLHKHDGPTMFSKAADAIEAQDVEITNLRGNVVSQLRKHLKQSLDKDVEIMKLREELRKTLIKSINQKLRHGDVMSEALLDAHSLIHHGR